MEIVIEEALKVLNNDFSIIFYFSGDDMSSLVFHLLLTSGFSRRMSLENARCWLLITLFKKVFLAVKLIALFLAIPITVMQNL